MERFNVTCAGHQRITIEFDNAHAAQAYVEHVGNGQVVKFRSQRNMPGMLPEVEWKCAALWTFNSETRLWEARSIYSGCAEVIAHVSPTGEECAA